MLSPDQMFSEVCKKTIGPLPRIGPGIGEVGQPYTDAPKMEHVEESIKRVCITRPWVNSPSGQGIVHEVPGKVAS